MQFRRAYSGLAAFAVLVSSAIVFDSGVAAQDTIDEARAAAEAKRAEIADTESAMATAQTEANEAAEILWQAKDDLEAIEVEIEQLGVEIQTTEGELDLLADDVRTIAVDRYVDAQDSGGFFAEEDINETVRADALSRYVANTKLSSVDQYSIVRSDLDALEAELDEKTAEQAALIKTLETAQVEANARLDELTVLTEDLNAELDELEALEARLVAEEEARLAAIEAERQRIAAEEAARQAEEEAAAQAAAAENEPEPDTEAEPDADADSDTGETGEDPDQGEDSQEPDPQPTATPTPEPPAPPPASSTGWVCPVAGPNSFIDSWGAPRVYGRWHKGTDMMADTGVPVVAVVSGTVEHRGNTVGGLSAHLTADDGTYFYYTHLSGYANEGAGYVAQGTVIGYVGMTGNAPIPHLHFEHHPGGRGNPVNPYPTLIASC